MEGGEEFWTPRMMRAPMKIDTKMAIVIAAALLMVQL